MQLPARDLPRSVPPLVLLALAIIFFLPAAFGRVHLETDGYNWFYPWRAARVGADTGACVPLANPLLLDPLLIYMPQDRLLNACLKQGTLPLWDPFSFCGHPLQAVGHPSQVYPLRVLFHAALPPLAAREAILFVHMLACGAFMYLFLRQQALSRGSSLLGGVTYMLGGYLLTYLEFEFVTMVAAHVPLILLLVDRVARSASLRTTAALSLSIGSLILVGHWQYVTYGMMAVGAWMLYRTAGLWRDRSARARVGLLAAGLSVGVLVAAVQVLPSIQLVAASGRPAVPQDVLYGGARFLPENLLTLWAADALGHPAHDFFLAPMRSGVQNYLELCAYIGIVPLVLAVMALYRPRPPCLFFGVMGLAGLLYAMACPPLTWLYYVLPGFKAFTPVRTIFFYALSAPVLAAFGLERVLHGNVGRVALRAALVVWGGSVAGLAWFSALVGDRSFVERLALRYPAVLELPNYCSDRRAWIAHVLDAIQNHYRLTQPTLMLPLLLGLVGLLALEGWRRGRLGALPLVAVVLVTVSADLLFLGYRFDVTFPAASALPPAPAIDYLVARGHDPSGAPYRMACLIRPIHPNLPTNWGLQDVAGYGSLSPGRTWRLITEASGGPQTALMADLGEGSRFSAGLAALMNVRHVCTDPLHPLAGRTPAHQGDLNVYDWPVTPRFMLVSQVRVAADPDQELAAVLAPDFRPDQTVWLEAAPPAETASSGPATGTVSGVQYGLNTITLDVQASRSAWLVWGDSWWPGWQARLDGMPTPVLRADYAFRAVYVTAGTHRLAMVFHPLPFYAGLWISAGALGACVLMMALSGRRA